MSKGRDGMHQGWGIIRYAAGSRLIDENQCSFRYSHLNIQVQSFN